MMTELPYLVSMRFSRLASYVTMLGDRPLEAVFAFNKRTYEMLSPFIQSAIKEASLTAGKYHSDLMAQAADGLTTLLEEDGLVISRVATKPWRNQAQAAMRELEREGLWKEGLLDQMQRI
jgi:TRAP-type C4-dicarboxylate transport system substrate-binding protein